MSEKANEWPRVHTCLYGWCPAWNSECERCDKILTMVRGEYRYDRHVVAWVRHQFDVIIQPLPEGKVL